jgi:hypothetical protein
MEEHMKISKYIALAAFPLVLAACGTDDDMDDTWTDPGLTTTPETTATPETREHTVDLDEVAGSGLNGEARLRAIGGQTEVMISIENAGPNQTLYGGVHRGTCDMPGEQVASLQQISTDAEGNGQGMSTVNIPGWGTTAATTGTPTTTGDTLAGTPGTTAAANQHVIAYRTSQDQNAPLVLCGELRTDDRW